MYFTQTSEFQGRTNTTLLNTRALFQSIKVSRYSALRRVSILPRSTTNIQKIPTDSRTLRFEELQYCPLYYTLPIHIGNSSTRRFAELQHSCYNTFRFVTNVSCTLRAPSSSDVHSTTHSVSPPVGHWYWIPELPKEFQVVGVFEELDHSSTSTFPLPPKSSYTMLRSGIQVTLSTTPFSKPLFTDSSSHLTQHSHSDRNHPANVTDFHYFTRSVYFAALRHWHFLQNSNILAYSR